MLILKHIHRFVVAKGVGFIFAIFGTVCVTGAITVAAMFVVNQTDFVTPEEPLVPILACALIAAIVGWNMMSIFTFSSDAILQSFLMDEELGFQGSQRPEAMVKFANTVKSQGKGCCD